MVIIKFKDLRIDEIPARCRDRIARSTEAPEWNSLEERGGQTVHPVPLPVEVTIEVIRSVREDSRSQNLMLFIRGNAMSGVDIIIGISQFPNPPIIIGITIKKIIMKAWAVTMELYI